MRTISRRAVAPIAIALTILVGAGDYASGVELTFTLMYLFPIAFAAWMHGRAAAVIVALCAGACTVVVGAEQHWLPLVWNAIGSLVIFVFVAYVVDALRRYVERERRERILAVEQLRHAERLNVIGTMAAGVAHELGTPLGVISGSAELLEIHAQDPARVKDLAQRILRQSARMTAIIRHLLDFGRRGGAKRADAELDAIVRAAVDLTAAAARKRGVRVDLELDPAPLYARVNPSEIEQVLSNLLVNAIHASRGGAAVLVRAHADHAFAEIAIEDRGTGIAPDDLPRIFDPFFTTKGVGEGTGLGLSVSYGIVRDHGGAIEVASEPGRGSRFTVRLPLAHDTMA
ncbi:MAG TPA: HAMP domain-containing sensor histidine kinase [Kofleriaceae bacterium]|jgi:signal transduction histidine kinase|nr:HAMP domain-containing sensor histidine kinase [Kofleriaceae bacterium]